MCDGWDLVRRFLFSLFMSRHNLLLEAVLKQTPLVRVVIMPLGLQLWESQGARLGDQECTDRQRGEGCQQESVIRPSLKGKSVILGRFGGM